MGLWRDLWNWRSAPTPDSEPSATFSVELSTPIDELISRSALQTSTAPVRRDLALTVPPVLRARNLMCSIATLPLITRDEDLHLAREPFLAQIDPQVANVVTLAQTIEDLLFDGISWWQITDRYANGFPRAAMHIDEYRVSLQPPPSTSRSHLRTLPSGDQLGGVVWVDGLPVSGRNMIRFDSPNPGIRTVAARSIRRAILLERAAAMYAEDPRAQDFFTPADGADPVPDPEVQEILDSWQQSRRERATAYVPASLKYQTVNAMSPADLQLVELQKQVAIDIANATGLDAEDLQVSTTSRTYANATDRRRDRINDTFSPYMRAITDRLSMGDVTRRGYAVEFDLDDYMRADPLTRWQTHEIALRNNVESVNEVRVQEKEPAVPVEPAARPARRQPQQEQETGMSTTTTVRFADETQTTRITFDMSDEVAQFRVNRESRTISGLLVPWNKVASNGWAKWRFSRDSLHWSKTSRIKLNRDHDRSQAVGYATDLKSTDAGLEGTFKIARGAEGDQVLSLAEDKVLDGFSVEVDFDAGESSWGVDPDDDMVRLVHSGRLVGTAITSAPAFDDARVSGVAATRKDSPMGDTKVDVTEAKGPAQGPDKDTAAAFTAAVEAFSAKVGGFTEAVSKLVEVQQRNGEGPTVVDPTRRPAQYSVREEPLYRFDGSRGKHDFSTDIIAGAKGDYDALGRVEKWVGDNFAFPHTANFDIDSAAVDSLNPDRQRPDLYVDQLEYATPIWNSIRKGTIDDNTPFVLPKFSSASGLVGDHTEGTEPTAGSFATTSQTITPSPVSGRVEVTREAWDQGGNPQLSTILWRQMVRAYNEALEQASADLLDDLTGVTEIDLGTDDDDALAQSAIAALAALQFVRGGFRFRDFKLEQGLYTALAKAKDTTGRPMFPTLGATNADGTTGQFFGAIEVAGLAAVPAWALPITVSGTPNTPGESFLYNREDVHGWASNPQRLDFQYRVAYVDVAVWGYKALAVTRTDGVRRVKYDSLG